jgi:hypothetical protein
MKRKRMRGLLRAERVFDRPDAHHQLRLAAEIVAARLNVRPAERERFGWLVSALEKLSFTPATEGHTDGRGPRPGTQTPYRP